MAGKFKKNRSSKTSTWKVSSKKDDDSDIPSEFDGDEVDIIPKGGLPCKVDDRDLGGNNDSGSSFEESSENDDDSQPEDVTEALEDDRNHHSSLKRKYAEIANSSAEVKSKKKKKDLQKPPTAQEVAMLRETENLFHSNLFRLQIEEMLSELKIKKKMINSFSDWFSLLKQSLLEMKPEKSHELMKQKWLSKLGISMPLLQKPYDLKGMFTFLPPSSVYIMGSYAVGCSLGPNLNVDIAVEMPTKCFQGSDHINHRYLRKRALYLCKVVAHLKSTGIISYEGDYTPHFELPRADNPLIPVAAVVPSFTLPGRAKVYIHITVPAETFKLSKLGPSKNSVRSDWYFNKQSGERDDKVKESSTPIHNASILCDLVAKDNEALKGAMLQDFQNMKDGIILLKVWLRQRELDKGFSAFGNYLMTMLVVYLLRIRKLSSFMSSYQVARNVWNFLKDSDWTTHGLSLCEKPTAGAPTLQEFHDNYEVVFVDCSGYCNLAAHLDAISFMRVKAESALAIKCLDDPSVNSFQVLFMKPAPFCRRFDHIICFYNLDLLQQMAEREASDQNKLDRSHHPILLAATCLMAALKRGLSKRVAEWGVHLPKKASWSIEETPPTPQGSILLGINLNPEHAYSILDKGPEADLPEAQEFREFWGSKSELRRFQDGSISEAVVWHSEKDVTLSQRRVLNKIVTEYILKNKLGLNPSENIVYLADQLEEVLALTRVKTAFAYGTGEEASLAVISSLDRLSSQLRGLSDLPLDISGVHGCSPVCRYTDVFPPLSSLHTVDQKTTKPGDKCLLLKPSLNKYPAPHFISPVEVILQLALSGKWPDDAQAVRRVRAAFSIKIADCLQTQCGLTTQAFPNYVDVLKDGFVFRLRVAYQREPGLLRQCLMPDGLMRTVECKEAQVLDKETNLLPKISSYLHGLQQQQPAFGPATCLAKRWFAAHMIGWSHFPEEAVELLMARLFLSPEPYSVTAQPQTAFLRFLHLLSTTNWHLEPVILNFNNEFKRDDIVEIERKFLAERSKLPALFIATPSEYEQSVWTNQAPNLIILARISLLASESLKVLQSYYISESASDVKMWKQVFRPSLEDFNVIIHLQTGLKTRRSQWIDFEKLEKPQALHPYKKVDGEKIPITGFDPVQSYVSELEEAYSEFALFFHDCYGGNVIGVVWKPTAMDPKDFKVSHINGRRLKDNASGSTPELVVNKETFIEDFYFIGKDLVRSIEVRR